MQIQKTNNKKQKTETVVKFQPRELIPYIADLTGLFTFSVVNNKRRGRHQW